MTAAMSRCGGSMSRVCLPELWHKPQQWGHLLNENRNPSLSTWFALVTASELMIHCSPALAHWNDVGRTSGEWKSITARGLLLSKILWYYCSNSVTPLLRLSPFHKKKKAAPWPKFSAVLDNKFISLLFRPVVPQITKARRGNPVFPLLHREDYLSDCTQPHLGSLSESNGWHRCHCESNLTCKTLNTGDNVQEGKKPAGAISGCNYNETSLHQQNEHIWCEKSVRDKHWSPWCYPDSLFIKRKSYLNNKKKNCLQIFLYRYKVSLKAKGLM